MKKIYTINLSEKAAETLKKFATYQKYSADSSLQYKGQVPIVAYFIEKGHILLLKGNKTYHKLNSGCLFGYYEMSANIPLSFTAEIQSNTEVYYIDKSDLLEIQNAKTLAMRQLQLELTNVVA